MYENRIQSLRDTISDKSVDAMLVLIEENRRYLSGFLGEDHQFDESAGALLTASHVQTDPACPIAALPAVQKMPIRARLPIK